MITTIFLLLSVLLAFFINNNSELARYSVQIVGLLVILYFINYFQKKKESNYSLGSQTIDSLIITLVVTLVVLATGGTNSPALFLIFLLAAFLSLMINPAVACIVITLVGLLLPIDSLQFFIWLITPIFISLIGKQYLKLLESQQKIKVIETKEKILENEVSKIQTDVSTFSSGSLKTISELIKNLSSQDLVKVSQYIKTLQNNIISLPDKIDEEVGT